MAGHIYYRALAVFGKTTHQRISIAQQPISSFDAVHPVFHGYQSTQGTDTFNFRNSMAPDNSPCTERAVAEIFVQQPRILIIEGGIACGKTTLCEYIAKESKGSAVIFPENADPEFLRLFYSDKPKYGFSLQMHMLESRTNATQLRMLRIATEAAAASPTTSAPLPSIALLDRSVVGDFVFAVTNYITGSISDAEIRVYFSISGCSSIDDVHLLLERVHGAAEGWSMLYLHSPFDQCKERVDTVRGTCEKDVLELWYYQVLEQVYFNTMLRLRNRYGWRVCVSPWSHYSAQQEIYGDVVGLAKSGTWSGDGSNDSVGDCGMDAVPATSATVAAAATGEMPPLQVDINRMKSAGVQWYSRERREELLQTWTLSAGNVNGQSVVSGSLDSLPDSE